MESLRRIANNLLAVAYREWSVVRHDKAFLGAVAIQPVIVVLLFGLVLSSEPRNVPWALFDQSGSVASRRLAQEIEATGIFLAPRSVSSTAQGRELLLRGEATALVVIPRGFHRDLWRGRPRVQVLLDGADPLTAARVGSYLAQITESFDAVGRVPAPRTSDRAPGSSAAQAIVVRPRFWFNPTLRDRSFFLAAIAGALLTNFCFSVSALGIVGERESGTYEATLSLPISVFEIVLGKLLPHVLVSYAVLGISLLGAGLGFGVWPRGSWLALGLVTLPFVFASLTVGVLVSALVRTSAQAVFLTVFVILPSFVLSGLLFPHELMPEAVRNISGVLPMRWYQLALRRIVLRGAEMDDVLVPLAVLLLLFAVLLALVLWRTKPRLA